ncbi:MAG TPA: hypothetical protein VGR97_08160 [Candidatus Acidoferrales bacterium]|nr:hypothetical protein [Candidatus Acidoferrales bacterium]
MQSAQTLTHSGGSPQTVPTVKTPHTFQAAVKQGWAVISDKSVQSINQKRREGKLTLWKAGCDGLLTVDYIGSVKGGFRFSVPKFAN